MAHRPQVGDIWKNIYGSDKYYSPNNYIEDYFLIYDVDADNKENCLAYSFMRGLVRRITVRDFESIASNKWSKVG